MLAAIVAFLIGITAIRPTMLKAARVAAAMQAAAEADRPALQAQLGALRTRATTANLAAAVLLAVATLTMAVARYL
ncbi:MAG: hypothetical protein R2882_04650 [Gemmatimonadales bacterium]